MKDFEKKYFGVQLSAPNIRENTLHCRLCYYKPSITQLRLTAQPVMVTEIVQITEEASQSQPP